MKKYIEGHSNSSKSNSLFIFCFECFKSNSYERFFERLEQRLFGNSTPGLSKTKLPKFSSRSIEKSHFLKNEFKIPKKSHQRVYTLNT